MTTIAADPNTTETEDRLAILELIGRLTLAVDGSDWDALERLFTDPVHLDRTSLWGGEPETYSPEQLSGGFAQTMGNLDAIHHLITSHVISLNGDEATCAANMQGIHVLANASGGPIWSVGGRHDYDLKWTADGWRIAGWKFSIQWATGNMNIINLALAANGERPGA